jgi:hypothetical protein
MADQGMAGTLAILRQKRALVDLVPSEALLALQEYNDMAEEVSSIATQTVQVLTGKQSNILVNFNPKRTLVLWSFFKFSIPLI